MLLKVALSQKILENFYISQRKYTKWLSWAENLNKLFTFLGGKFKFSAQDSDLEYLFWQCKKTSFSLCLKYKILADKFWPLAYLILYYICLEVTKRIKSKMGSTTQLDAIDVSSRQNFTLILSKLHRLHFFVMLAKFSI